MNKDSKILHDLYIVESPFQLISAIEAKNHFETKDSVLIIRYTLDKKNNEQMDFIAKIVQWDKIITIKTHKLTFDSDLKLLSLIKILSAEKKEFRNIFIGEYRSWVHRMFLKNIAHQSAYLLDDGNGIINLQAHYLPFLREYESRPLKLFLYKLYSVLKGLKWKKIEILNLFTSFELKPFIGQTIIRNDFSFIRSQLTQKRECKDTVFFFGSNLSGQNVISEEYEISLLEKIKNYYESLNVEFIYIPHRRESFIKIEKIKNAIKVNVQEFSLPAEIELIKLPFLPERIATFYSNSISSLSKIHSFKCIDSFFIEQEKIKPIYREAIAAVYEEYAKSFNVIDLNA